MRSGVLQCGVCGCQSLNSSDSVSSRLPIYLGFREAEKDGEDHYDGQRCEETETSVVLQSFSGCVCCTVRGDLVNALAELGSQEKPFDAVIVELTGLADPAPVSSS